MRSISKKMKKKKSLFNILILLLIIFLILIALIVLWNILSRLILKDEEKISLQRSLINAKMEIVGKPQGDFVNYMNLSLKRGPERIIVFNRTKTFYEINPNKFADIISTVDLSNSMNNVEIHGCFGNSSSECCQLHNCSNSSGCAMCNKGILREGRCEFQTYNPPCCYKKNCAKNETECTGCGGNFSTRNITSTQTSCKINNYNVETYCINPSSCNPICKGDYVLKRRIDFAKEANELFVKEVFNQSANHRIGFVPYSTSVLPVYSYNLSNESISLTNKIKTWTPAQHTNICAGINESIQLLKSSGTDPSRIKVIVLMSDGYANIFCNGSFGNIGNNYKDVKEEVIKMANSSFKKNRIRIYTVGFGTSADKETLEKIAKEGNGTYSHSNISSLNEIYRQIANIIKEQISESYKPFLSYDHIKIIFINDTTRYEYRTKKIPDILETIDYRIPDSGILSNHITNIKRIEIYAAAYTESGNEMLSPLLDSYNL